MEWQKFDKAKLEQLKITNSIYLFRRIEDSDFPPYDIVWWDYDDMRRWDSLYHNYLGHDYSDKEMLERFIEYIVIEQRFESDGKHV